MEDKKIKVVFVCTGNICRSPMAEAAFKQLVHEAGLSERFVIESAGTASYHIGERPHVGTRQVLKEHNIPLDPEKRAERVDRDTIEDYDYIVAMDSGHEAALKKYGSVHLLLAFAPQTGVKDVPDPYYEDNFDQVYDLVTEGSKGLLAFIREQEDL